ncbi:unnamed protein product [Adineta steineri]|uniref:beta-N-acetylhexosaminidase n=1 Tax=Adineta steineri TaxID=433720 RepID=A0A815KJ16_9BILA|nr:unnamed protein product [Adineta steineri]CAF1393976.1 unnamed protein product [Adineta steineri]CAF1397637.1 unnamed protein product [Adineta steineri]
MFLSRRASGFRAILIILTIVLILIILSKYFVKNNHQRSISMSNYDTNTKVNIFTQKNLINKNSEFIKNMPNLPSNLIQIVNHSISLYVHFDLKGASPKISYFEKLFPLLHKWGATGICIEYEDMFPFDGIVSSIKHKQAYTKDDIEKINQLAKENHLDVMPLLQTYGHLEFLLKLKDFSDLRENPKYPQVITPCINKTYTILFSMIDQYLNLHPNIRFFHIGHDEVYYFLTNPACEEFQRLTGIQNQYDLFAYHLNIIANYIKKKSPDIILFVWHDVLQNLNIQMLQKYNLLNLINPVLWSYREDMHVEGFVIGSQADLFGQYQTLWGATAFKGATNEIATLSDVKHYHENQLSWIKQLQLYIPTKWKNFDGVILTGWSRYDHFLSLCELLPYSIPSMIYSIAAWQQQFSSLPKLDIVPSSLHEYVQKQLECSSALHITVQDHSTKPVPKCKFPGAGVYEAMISLPRIWLQVQEAESFVNKYVTDLHVRYKYIHIKRGEECLEKLTPVINLLKAFLISFTNSMNEVFPSQVAIEWLETYFMKRYNLVNERHEFIQHAVNEQKSWLPRPIPDTENLEINYKNKS